MAYTQTDLASVTKAIATGTKRVTVEGKTVEYQELNDLLALKRAIEAELAPNTGLNISYFQTSKGLGA